jgi:hypothetical protein
MRFWYNNLVDLAATVISASTYLGSLGPSNVAHPFKSKPWRTAATGASEWIKFDLGSAKAATSVILFAHTLTAGDSTIQLRASTDNFGASDVLIASLTYATTISATFASASYRYWKIVFTKSSAAESRDIGRIFLGTYTDTAEEPDHEGLDIQEEDLSVNLRAAGGQVYTDQKDIYRTILLNFSAIPHADVNALRAITGVVKTGIMFFIQVDTIGSSEAAEILYVKFKKLIPRKASGAGADILYDCKVEMEECL